MCLLTSNTESRDEEDDDAGVGVVKELVDKPGTANGTEFDFVLLPLLLKCGF